MAGGRLWDAAEDRLILEGRDYHSNELVAVLRKAGYQRTMRAIEQRRFILRNDSSVFRLPASDKPRYDDPISLPGPSAVVISDVHLPFHDALFIERVLGLAVAWGVDTCVINGDLLDMAAFSKFGPDPDDVLEEELQAAEDFMTPIATSFKSVAYCLGNHEARLLGKALNRQLKSQRFLRLFCNADNVQITSYEWIRMQSPRGSWVFCHPKNSSIIPTRVPGFIADRRFAGHHVVGAHGHLWGIARNSAGTHYVIDQGCVLDPERCEYAMKSVSTRPSMVQGALIIKDGLPYLLEPASDFTALTRLYAPEVTA